MDKNRTAEPALQDGVSRRALLKTVPALAGVAFFLGTDMASPPAAAQVVKLGHDVSKYQDMPRSGQECSTCVQFEPPGSCKLVADPISPHGWCAFYAKKS